MAAAASFLASTSPPPSLGDFPAAAAGAGVFLVVPLPTMATAAGAEGKLPVATEESLKLEGTPTPATELGTSS